MPAATLNKANSLFQPPANEHFIDWSHILFDQAQLSEGAQLEDPAAFVRRLNQRLVELGA